MVECGNALLKNGYKLKILNTINFKKSMHYNPFAYVPVSYTHLISASTVFGAAIQASISSKAIV